MAVLVGVLSGSFVAIGQVRVDPIASGRAEIPATPRSTSGSGGTGGAGRSTAGGSRGTGSAATGGSGAADRTAGRGSSAADPPAGGAAAADPAASASGGPADAVPAAIGADASSSAPRSSAAAPGVAPTDAALPPAPGTERFGGGSWALDLPAAAGWEQTAVQELAGGRTLLTRLRRADGARLIVEHRPGQTTVFGPWPGEPFAVRLPGVGRTEAVLFRGGRFAMCRDAVCAAAPVNGPSGGVLLVASAVSDDQARSALRRAARGLRVD